MQKINSTAALRDAILQLEIQKDIDEKLLKEQFHLAQESIKPINLLKSVFKEVTTSPDVKDQIIGTSAGLTAGYISKKLFEGVTRGPFTKLIGSAIMLGITKVVAKNPETVRSLGNSFFKMLRRQPKVDVETTENYENE